MKTMRIGAALMTAALWTLAGCGSSGQTGDAISGKLVDGYIKGALVCLDVDRNLKCDAGEPAAITGSSGEFTFFPVKGTATTGLLIVAEIEKGATDSDFPGQPVAATRMLGFADEPAVVSPLTTVVASMVLGGATRSDAQASARALLGLSPTFDFSTDYIAGGNTDAHAIAQAVNAVARTALSGATINATRFLNTLTQVKDNLHGSNADLQTALSQLFNLGDVLIGDFDSTTPGFGAIGGASAAIGSAPAGGSGNALKVVRVAGSEKFAGATVDLATAVSGSQYYTVSARVNVAAQAAGKPVKLKLESSDGSAQSDEMVSRETTVPGWQTLTWIFNTSPGRTYNKLIVLPNVDTAGAGETYYLDDINLHQGWVLADFDAFTPAFFGSNGSAVVTRDAAPTGGVGNALKVVKNAGDTWAGAVVNLDAPLRNATSYTVSARVWSPTAGIPMTLRLANFNDDSQSAQATATEPVVRGWQTLTWKLTGVTDWWWLGKLIFQPADGLQGSGEAYYIDDIKTRVTAVQLANFDDVVPSWFGSNGSALVTSEAAPDGGAGQVLKVVKNPSDTWAGAAVNLDRTIKGATSYTLSARVYSATAGGAMLLKLANLNDDTQSVTAVSKEPVVVGWQTLTWELSGAQDWWWLNKLYFQPDDGVAGTGQTYYIDDIVELTK